MHNKIEKNAIQSLLIMYPTPILEELKEIWHKMYLLDVNLRIKEDIFQNLYITTKFLKFMQQIQAMLIQILMLIQDMIMIWN